MKKFKLKFSRKNTQPVETVNGRDVAPARPKNNPPGSSRGDEAHISMPDNSAPAENIPSLIPSDAIFNHSNSLISKDSLNTLSFRAYQREAFLDRLTGIECWLWGRQTGKSLTLAAWAVDRLITRPGRLVTILSNSRTNGAEVNLKCAEICQKLQQAFEQEDLSTDRRFETMNYETRISVHGKVGRIKVLAANPKTARGFSGDLLLDEFAFHENSAAIWEAAEPILASNPDFLCRIASTPNGRHNMFYRLVTSSGIPVRKVTRTDAWKDGLQIFHPITRESITPAQARALASDKRAYDQNYECAFEAENMALLTYELISAAEHPGVGIICDENWTEHALSFLSGRACAPRAVFGAPAENSIPRSSRRQEGHLCSFPDPEGQSSPLSNHSNSVTSPGDSLSAFGGEGRGEVVPQSRSFPNQNNSLISYDSLIPPRYYAGVDVGRYSDLTVVTVLEKSGHTFIVRAMLRMRGMRLPQQQERLAVICRLPQLVCMKIDMTGLGLGLYEYTQQQFSSKIRGHNFSSTVEIKNRNGFTGERVRIPEALATQLLQIYEDRRIQHPVDELLREDLRKPERLVSPGGRVSIAASRDANGHADHFWSLALAIDAAMEEAPAQVEVIPCEQREFIPRDYLL